MVPVLGSMHIYSLADPERPVEVGHYGEYVHDIHVSGTRGYASLIYDGYLAVLDLSDLRTPGRSSASARRVPSRTVPGPTRTSDISTFAMKCPVRAP